MVLLLDSDDESDDNSDAWGDEDERQPECSSGSESDSGSDDDNAGHTDAKGNSRYVFNGEIVHQCFANTGLNMKFLETFLWELNVDYKGVRQIIVCGEDYQHQTDRVPRMFFDKGGVLHNDLLSLPPGAKIFEKLPTAMKLDGDDVDPVGSLHYIKNNMNLQKNIRRCFIGTVDIATGLGIPYHRDVNKTTRDGDPMEKQGVVMDIDASISLRQQTAVNFASAYKALQSVLKREHPGNAVTVGAKAVNQFLGAGDEDGGGGEAQEMEKATPFLILPSLNLELLKQNATLSGFKNNIRDSELVNVEWHAFELFPIPREKFEWIPVVKDVEADLGAQAEAFLGVKRSNILNGSPEWSRITLERILNYITYCTALKFAEFSGTKLKLEASTIQCVKVDLYSSEVNLTQKEWLIGKNIAIENRDGDRYDSLAVTNDFNESFFFVLRRARVLIFKLSGESSLEARMELINASDQFRSLGNQFKSPAGVCRFILDNHRIVFNISIQLSKAEIFKSVFEPGYRGKKFRTGRWKGMNNLFDFFKSHFKANVKENGSDWNMSVHHEIQWVRVVFSIDEDARQFADYCADFKNSIPKLAPFPKSYYRTSDWLEEGNLLILEKLATISEVAPDDQLYSLRPSNAPAAVQGGNRVTRTFHYVDLESANGFQIRGENGGLLTVTMRNGIVLMLFSEENWDRSGKRVHFLLNASDGYAPQLSQWFSMSKVKQMIMRFNESLWSLQPVVTTGVLDDSNEVEDEDGEEDAIDLEDVVKQKAVKWFDVIFGINKGMVVLSACTFLKTDEMEHEDLMNLAARCQGDRNEYKNLIDSMEDSIAELVMDNSGGFFVISKFKHDSMRNVDYNSCVRSIQFLCGDTPTGGGIDDRVGNVAFNHPNPWQFYVLENAGIPANVFTACTSGIQCDTVRFTPKIGTLKFFNFQMAMNWTLPASTNSFLLFLWSVYLSILNICLNTRNSKRATSEPKTIEFATMVYGNLKTFGLFIWFLLLKAKELKMDQAFINNLDKVLNMDPGAVLTDAYKQCVATALNLQIVEFILDEDFAVSGESNRLLVKVKDVYTTQSTYIFDDGYASKFFTCGGEPDFATISKDYTRAKPRIWENFPLPYFASKSFPVTKRTTFYEAIAFNLVGDDPAWKIATVIQFLKDSVLDLLHSVYREDETVVNGIKIVSGDKTYEFWDDEWTDTRDGVYYGGKFVPIHYFKLQRMVDLLIKSHVDGLKRYGLQISGDNLWNFKTKDDLTVHDIFTYLCGLYDNVEYIPNPVELEIFCEYANFSLTIFDNEEEHTIYMPYVRLRNRPLIPESEDFPMQDRSFPLYGKRYWDCRNYYMNSPNSKFAFPSREIILVVDSNEKSQVRFRNILYQNGAVAVFYLEKSSGGDLEMPYRHVHPPCLLSNSTPPKKVYTGYDCLIHARLVTLDVATNKTSDSRTNRYSTDWYNSNSSQLLFAHEFDKFIGIRPIQATPEQIKQAREKVKKPNETLTQEDQLIASYTSFYGILRQMDALGDHGEESRGYKTLRTILQENLGYYFDYPHFDDQDGWKALWRRYIGSDRFRALKPDRQSMSAWMSDVPELKMRFGDSFIRQLAMLMKRRIIIVQWNHGRQESMRPDRSSTTSDAFDIREIRDYNFNGVHAQDFDGDWSVDTHKQAAKDVFVVLSFVVTELNALTGKNESRFVLHPLKIPNKLHFVYQDEKAFKLTVTSNLPFLPDYQNPEFVDASFKGDDNVKKWFINSSADSTHPIGTMLAAPAVTLKKNQAQSTKSQNGDIIIPVQIHVINHANSNANARLIQRSVAETDGSMRAEKVLKAADTSTQDYKNTRNSLVEKYVNEKMEELKAVDVFNYGYCALLCHGDPSCADLSNGFFSKLYTTPERIVVDDEDSRLQAIENKTDARKSLKRGGKRRGKDEDKEAFEERERKAREAIVMKKTRLRQKILELRIDPSTLITINFRLIPDEYCELVLWRKVYYMLLKSNIFDWTGADPELINYDLRMIRRLFPRINTLMLSEQQQETFGPWLTFQRCVQISLRLYSTLFLPSEEARFTGHLFGSLNGNLSGNQLKLISKFSDNPRGTFRTRRIPENPDDVQEYNGDLVVSSSSHITFSGILHPTNFKLAVAAQVIVFLKARYELLKQKKSHDTAFYNLITKVHKRWIEHGAKEDFTDDERKDLTVDHLIFSDTKYDEWYKTLDVHEQYRTIQEDARVMSCLYFLKIKFVTPFGGFDSNSFCISSTQEHGGFYFYDAEFESSAPKERTLHKVWFAKHGLQWIQDPAIRQSRSNSPHSYFHEDWKSEMKTSKFLKDIKKLDPIEVHMVTNYRKIPKNEDQTRSPLLDLKGGRTPTWVCFEPCTLGKATDVALAVQPDQVNVPAGKPESKAEGGGGVDNDCPNRQRHKQHVGRGDQRSEAQQERAYRDLVMFDNDDEWGSRSGTRSCFLNLTKGSGPVHDGKKVTRAETGENGPVPSRHTWQQEGLDLIGPQSRDNETVNEDGKEIYMLSARVGSTMATLSHLSDGAFLLVKIHKALQPQAQAFASLLSSCFESFTAVPFTEVYTDHIQFVGRKFRKQRLRKYGLMSKLNHCMCLREDAFEAACEALAGEYDENDRAQLKEFRKHLAWCGDKVYAERFKHDILMCQVYLEGTLDGRIKKRIPWISQKAANLLNRKVFKRIPHEVRKQNIQTVMCILRGPFGPQLRPLFSPNCNPEIPLPCSTVGDQLRCIASHPVTLTLEKAFAQGRETDALSAGDVWKDSEDLNFFISLLESIDCRLKVFEGSL